MTQLRENPEFDKFTDFMDKLAKVPHGELKAELDAEKQEKQEPPKAQPTETLQQMATRGQLTLRKVHVSSFSADEGFIYFDTASTFTAELHKRSSLHGLTNPMGHEPSGFLSNSDRPRNLAGTNTVFAATDHPCCDKPLIQAERGILKDAANLDAELLAGVLFVAFPKAAGGNETHFLATASRALDAIRPAASSKEINAAVSIGEVENSFLKCGWCFHD